MMWTASDIEANFLLRLLGRIQQLADCLEDCPNLFIVKFVLSLEFVELLRKHSVGGEKITQPDEGPHDRNIHPNRSITFQDAREHGNALFREGIRKSATKEFPLWYHRL